MSTTAMPPAPPCNTDGPRVVLSPRDAEFVAWPFGHDELLKRMHACVAHLHESVDHTATDGVGRHAEADHRCASIRRVTGA